MKTPSHLHRREFKYLIDEKTVDGIRKAIQGICAVDENAAKTGGVYLTDTLYLDTYDWRSYRATMEDRDDRYKLRIRGYPSAPGAPIFGEVKRRVGDAILKTRAPFPNRDFASFLHSEHGREHAQSRIKDRDALDNFTAHFHHAAMRPAVLVRYEREPYFSLIDEYARVTFDRGVRCQPGGDFTLEPAHEHWTYVDHAEAQRGISTNASMVLLELKFTALVPHWMRKLVQDLDMPRLAFCKYTRSVDALRMHPLARYATGR